jgi:uncharacterized phage protein (TIGR02218 family)
MSSALAAHLAQPATTTCYLLKITPIRTGASPFGITTLDADVTYDDGTGSMVYRAKRGYTAFDVQTASNLSVDNSEAQGLLAEYPADGMTAAGIAQGLYDSARFVQYLVNYNDLTMGHCIINAGQVGQVSNIDELTVKMEMRSLTQILKQDSIIETTSITCRAKFGDERCKMPLYWYSSAVATVGAESDRVFTLTTRPGGTGGIGSTGSVSAVPFGQGDGTKVAFQLLDTAGQPLTSGFSVSAIKINGTIQSGSSYSISGTGLVTFTGAPGSAAQLTWDGTVTLFPSGYFSPGVVRWTSGDNAGTENEIESYDQATGTVTLSIPANVTIQVGDECDIRRDCDYSKAMCRDTYNNLLNMRAEPELPRADGTDLMSPTTAAPSN